MHNIVSTTNTQVAITTTVTMYAGLDAYGVNEYLFSVVSGSYTRTIYYWVPNSYSYTVTGHMYAYLGDGYYIAYYLPRYCGISYYNSYYITPNLVFTSMDI